jgi:hypothetical protein
VGDRAGAGREFVGLRQNWGEDRVHLHDGNGVLFSLPAGWTDVAAADSFVVIADGRCPFTMGSLLALAVWWTGCGPWLRAVSSSLISAISTACTRSCSSAGCSAAREVSCRGSSDRER